MKKSIWIAPWFHILSKLYLETFLHKSLIITQQILILIQNRLNKLSKQTNGI